MSVNTTIGHVRGIAFLNHEDGSISRIYFNGDTDLTDEERKTDQEELEKAYVDTWGSAPLMKRKAKEKQLAATTPEERIAKHVEDLANHHLAAMKASWGPAFEQPYRCETCGSYNPNTCSGWRCFERVIQKNTQRPASAAQGKQ